MKLIFNDATSIDIQKYNVSGNYIYIKLINTTPEDLIRIFQDKTKTSKMIIENNTHQEECVGYSEFYRIEEYIGRMFGVVMYREGKSQAERLADVEEKSQENESNLETAIAELTMLISSMVG